MAAAAARRPFELAPFRLLTEQELQARDADRYAAVAAYAPDRLANWNTVCTSTFGVPGAAFGTYDDDHDMVFAPAAAAWSACMGAVMRTIAMPPPPPSAAPAAEPAAAVPQPVVSVPSPLPSHPQPVESKSAELTQHAAQIPKGALIVQGWSENFALGTRIPAWTRVPRYCVRGRSRVPVWATAFSCDTDIGTPADLAALPVLRTSTNAAEFFSFASLNPAAEYAEAYKRNTKRRREAAAAGGAAVPTEPEFPLFGSPLRAESGENSAEATFASPSRANAAKRTRKVLAIRRAVVPMHLRVLSAELFPAPNEPQITLRTLNCPLTRRILAMVSHDRDPTVAGTKCGLRFVSTAADVDFCDRMPMEQCRPWAAGLLACRECAPALVRLLKHVADRLKPYACATAVGAGGPADADDDADTVPSAPQNTVYRNVPSAVLAEVLWFVEESMCVYNFKRRTFAAAGADSVRRRPGAAPAPAIVPFVDAVASLGRNTHMEVDVEESLKGISPTRATPPQWVLRFRSRPPSVWPCPSQGVVHTLPDQAAAPAAAAAAAAEPEAGWM